MLKPGQVAKKANVTPQTVRNWSTEYADFLTPQARGEAGPRLYSDADVDTICAIAALRKSGVPPAEVSERLANDENVAAVIDVEPTAKEVQSEAKNEIQTQNVEQPGLVAYIELLSRLEKVERVVEHQTDRFVTGVIVGAGIVLIVVAIALRMV